MTRTIRVDQQVYDAITRLQARAGDRNVNDAMRLLLGLPSKQRSKRPDTTCAVTAALRDRPGSTAAELADATGLAYSTTTSILAELKKAGVAQRSPDQRQTTRRGAITGHWHLSPPAVVPTAELCKLAELLRSLAQQAADQAAEARDDLAEQLGKDLQEDECDLTDTMVAVAYHQPYARWWNTLIHRIDHDGLDAATALHDTREAAHRALLGLDARTPGSHARDLWLILRGATGDFHRNTSPDILQTRYGITVPAGSAG